MKKFLTFIAAILFISITAFSQTRKPVFIVPDSITSFGVSMPSGVLIYDTGAKRIWALTAKVSATDSLASASKDFIVEGGGGVDLNGIYSGSGMLTGSTAVNGTIGDTWNLNFSNIGEYGVASESMILGTGIGGIDLNAATNVRIVSNNLELDDGAFSGFISTAALTSNRTYELKDSSGVLAFTTDTSNLGNSDLSLIGDRVVTLATNDLVFSRTTGNIGIGGTPLSTSVFDIQMPMGSDAPLSFYENRAGGAMNSDAFSLGFYFNDSGGARTLGGTIKVKVADNPTVGDVKMDMVFNNVFKLQHTSRMLVANSVSGKVANAQFEVRGEDAIPTAATTFLVVGRGTSTRTAFNIQNENGDHLTQILSNGRMIFNGANLSTSFFSFEGSGITNLFYADASVDAIGIGTATPDNSAILDIRSTTKGFQPPAMTTTQMNAITSVSTGLQIHNVTDSVPYFYNGVSWVSSTPTPEYASQGFADSTEVLALTQNVWKRVSNAADSLYTTSLAISGNLELTGDSIIISVSGDYKIMWDLSYSGANSDDYRLGIAVNGTLLDNILQTKRGMSSSNSGVSCAHGTIPLSTNDSVSLLIMNTANNNDATLIAGNIFIKKIN